MTHMYSACTYRLSGFRLESQEQNHGTMQWLGSFGHLSLLHFYRTANGTVEQIQPVIAAHNKYTLWRMQVYGS